MDALARDSGLAEMMLQLESSMSRIEGAFVPSSIWAYQASFAEFAIFT